MVVDTSALVAILLLEPEAERFAYLIRQDAAPRLSAASYVETSIVLLARGGLENVVDLDSFIEGCGLSIEPVSAEQARLARDGYRNFGRGNHPAGLNFGDCLAYALAKLWGETLLFKGGGFGMTDIASAA